ncbi:hypothetical protein RND81_07G148200 [Saponaria officinalis]|uniref:Transmembrane protein n=1 Tax=Saponaria officinalis TaxID=3572 RepID=A0AAW1JSB5_SAPOF
MEDTTWEQRIHTLTHILTTPTTNPSLHSQYFISNQIPCYLNWDYPPLLCTKHHPFLFLKYNLTLFLKRVPTFGIPLTSWRSKCPYFQPTPLILAEGVQLPIPGVDEKRLYVRKRLHRKPLQSDINPWIPFLVPNLLLFSLLLWNPFPEIDS